LGELGLGWQSNTKPTPFILATLKGKKIKMVACGWSHSFAIDSSDGVFAFGNNDLGQLGLGDTAIRSVPTRISFFDGKDSVVSIAAGRVHSLVLLSSGELYSFGGNALGQLGMSDLRPRSTPQLLSLVNGKIAKITAGRDHSLIVESGNNTLYGFGSNLEGQLGLGHIDIVLSPTAITTLSNITIAALSAGGDHSLVLASNGTSFSFGKNSNGQLGLGHTISQRYPQIGAMRWMNITHIAAGLTHSMGLGSDGAVYAFGMNFVRFTLTKLVWTTRCWRCIGLYFSHQYYFTKW
jgi:alpha-tubulin suppressor-like RCC1 family protein